MPCSVAPCGAAPDSVVLCSVAVRSAVLCSAAARSAAPCDSALVVVLVLPVLLVVLLPPVVVAVPSRFENAHHAGRHLRRYGRTNQACTRRASPPMKRLNYLAGAAFFFFAAVFVVGALASFEWCSCS